ncbi:hypothetical protein AB7M49_002767 [Bradyrhizobium elkanii]
MAGLVPGIHVYVSLEQRKTWMAGTSPAMTDSCQFSRCRLLSGFQVPRGFTRLVGIALAGSSGQGWRG